MNSHFGLCFHSSFYNIRYNWPGSAGINCSNFVFATSYKPVHIIQGLLARSALDKADTQISLNYIHLLNFLFLLRSQMLTNTLRYCLCSKHRKTLQLWTHNLSLWVSMRQIVMLKRYATSWRWLSKQQHTPKWMNLPSFAQKIQHVVYLLDFSLVQSYNWLWRPERKSNLKAFESERYTQTIQVL